MGSCTMSISTMASSDAGFSCDMLQRHVRVTDADVSIGISATAADKPIVVKRTPVGQWRGRQQVLPLKAGACLLLCYLREAYVRPSRSAISRRTSRTSISPSAR